MNLAGPPEKYSQQSKMFAQWMMPVFSLASQMTFKKMFGFPIPVGVPISASKEELNHFSGGKFLMVQEGLLGMHLQGALGSQTQAVIWGLLLLLLKLFI